MFSSFIQSIVLLTDAAFLSRYSTLAFDANGNAGLIYVTFYAALTGMSDGGQILIARRIGEEKWNGIQQIIQSSIFLLGILALLFFVLLRFLAPIIIPQITQNQDLAAAEIDFLSIRSFALFFGIISLSIQSYFFALGKTWIVLIGAGIIAITNIILDACLIFGNSWFPEMGLEGASLASTLAEGIGMLYFMIAISIHSKKINYSIIGKWKATFNDFMISLKVGLPLFFQSFFGLATWTIFFTWIENRGSFELTVSQNIRSLYFLAFIPLYGFAGTTKTYISQYLGNGKAHQLKEIQRKIIILSILFMVLIFHGAFLYPEKLIRLINPAEEFVSASATILRFVAFSILIYSISNVFMQTISGSGNTKITFLIECIGCGIYISYAYIVLRVVEIDLFWVWSIEYIYFIGLLIMSLVYLKFYNWRSKKI